MRLAPFRSAILLSLSQNKRKAREAVAMYHQRASQIHRRLSLPRTTERDQSMPEPQTYKNHVRYDPIWHFFITPLLLLNILFAIYATIHHWPTHRVLFCWWIVMAIVLLLAVGRARQHSLTAQDRCIRLEERLRFAALLPADELARSQALTKSQIIGLRFASDTELPALVKRTLDENLTQKQIKEAIVTWRPDYLRV
jgi:hypothetical protein